MKNYLRGFGLVVVFCTQLQAAPYTPSAADEIVAEWNYTASPALQKLQAQRHLQPENTAALITLAQAYLTQAAQPGYSRLYGLAQATLAPSIARNEQDANLWFVWAQLLQHQHHFSEAQIALEKVLALEPTNAGANLLAARIYLIQAQPIAARNACIKLLGQADLLSISACSLEVASQKDEAALRTSYEQLQLMLSNQGLPSDERAAWILQMLADMALRLDEFEAAEIFLDKVQQKNSVSYWAQWSDVQLKLGHGEAVVNALSKILAAAPEMDDALLVRIVLAEQQQATNNHKRINNADRLQELRARVELREARGDQAHAADLAIYYLDIAPNAERALSWAQANWQAAREPSDKALLARAQAAVVLTKGE